jgi:dTDP-4-amino-4,6-dideoxygalactose transaminase
VTRIYLSPPHVTDEDRAALLGAFDSGWIAPAGPDVDAFEEEFAARLGVPDAVALSSGTAGLHLALIALKVTTDDLVLVSDLTFAASANAVRYVGATPVFIDSEPSTWNIDPSLVAEELATMSRQGHLPKAVIAVDLYGQAADYFALRQACAQYHVPIIEDAAEALGATYSDQTAGTLGEVGVFSFNGNKIITTSGGGMLIASSAELTRRARHLASQAREPVSHYEHTSIGYNYRLSNLLAALGRSQLRQLDERVARRAAINARYRVGLGDLPGIDFMPEAAYGRPTWWLTCVTVDPSAAGLTRDDVSRHLAAHDIEARPTWKPMHMQPIFRGARCVRGTVAETIFRDGLCLPSGSSLAKADLERIIGLIRECWPSESQRQARYAPDLRTDDAAASHTGVPVAIS